MGLSESPTAPANNTSVWSIGDFLAWTAPVECVQVTGGLGVLRRGGGRLARQTGAKPPGLPGAASQAYPNPGSTPVSNGGDYETWQMFLRQGQRADPPAAVGSGVHRLRGGRVPDQGPLKLSVTGRTN